MRNAWGRLQRLRFAHSSFSFSESSWRLLPALGFFERALGRFELLSGLAKLALCSEPLVIIQVLKSLIHELLRVLLRRRRLCWWWSLGRAGCFRFRLLGFPLRDGRWLRRFAEEALHGLFKCLPVAEPVLCGEHDQSQLRHRAALGLQVDGLDVEQRAPDGDDEQVAATHARALLAPERYLRRELRVLIYARFDLQRPVNEPRLRKIVGDQRPVRVAVAA